jgi:3-dehydroquinate synthetase
MLLNLGHTIGQALEVLSNYRLRHGEAVLIGLQLELMIAREARLITSADATRIGALLQRTGFEPRPQNLHLQALIKNVFRGKNKPRFILPTAIGHVIATNEIEQSLVRHVIRSFSGK